MPSDITEYDIWKITGAGNRPRYYESYQMFSKYLTIFKSYTNNIKAFRFTSSGWR